MKRTVSSRSGAEQHSRRRKDHDKKFDDVDPKRTGRDPEDDDSGEGIEEELDTFRRRAQWWRQYRGDASGVVSGGDLRLQAIAHAEKLAADGLDNPEPGGTRPKSGFQLIGRGRAKIKAARGENPRPRSSFGFCSDAIEVRGPINLEGVVLKIALDAKRTQKIEAATVRIFCFSETSREWQLVPRSGALPQAGYAWAHLHRPGTYVAIGLPANPDVFSAVLTIRALMPRLRAASDKAGRRGVIQLIGKLLSPKKPRRAKADAAVNELNIAGLDLPGRGLPEFDIFDEIYRPMGPRRKNSGKEVIERIRWGDIHTDLGGVISWFNEWVSVGPRNFSGAIKSLAIHAVEVNRVLAGASDGGVWRTQDAGGSWLPLMDQELSMAIGGLASDADLRVIYAATGVDAGPWGPVYPGVGVYKSIDGGNTWILLAPNLRGGRCTRALIHPANADIVYVSGNFGLYKSTDGGASWTQVRRDHISDILMDPTAPDTIYAGSYYVGIFRTTDAGASWEDFNDGLPTGNRAGWIKLAATDPLPDGSVTLVAKMGVDSTGLNSGQLFTRRIHVPPVIKKSRRTRRVDWDSPGPIWQPLPGTHEGIAYCEWTNMPAINPSHDNVIFAGGRWLQRSTDGGASFSDVPGTHPDHHALVFWRPDNNWCYMATDGGVYCSIDGGASWTLCSTGLVTTEFYSVGVSQTNPFLLGGATQDQGILKTNGSADWEYTGAGNEGRFFIVDPSNSNNVYVSPFDHNLRRSTDGGSNWTTILNGITQVGMPPAPLTVQHLAVCPNNSNLLLCACGHDDPLGSPWGPDSGTVFRSTDQGNNWTPVLSFNPATGAICVAWYGPNTCYATNTNEGRIFRSTQQGAANTWSEPYTDANQPPYGTIIAIEARFVTLEVGAKSERRSRLSAGTNGINAFPYDLVYIAYSSVAYSSLGRVYKSIDGGAHWTNASGSGAGALPNTPISALVIDRDLYDTVYVATDIGVFRTRDGGANWEPFSDGLPPVPISGLVLQRATNTLYVSTMGRGVYQRALS